MKNVCFYFQVHQPFRLKSFRFFDIDNAEAVTTTGQQLIKSTGDFGSKFYNDELGTKDKDYCIYTDTDSVFFSAKPIIEKRFPNIDMNDPTLSNAKASTKQGFRRMRR